MLTERLLPSLLESSPFVRNVSNPMHHEHSGLDAMLERAGLRLEAATADGRLWRAGGA